MRYEEEVFNNFAAPLSLAPQNSGDADTAYTSATSSATFGVLHVSISVVVTATRALKRMFTGERDCMVLFTVNSNTYAGHEM
jgi:hypothetical protein